MMLPEHTGTKTLFELFNTPTRIYQFLLACVKRMALRTYLYLHVFSQSRACFQYIATITCERYLVVLGVCILFHVFVFEEMK